VARISKTLKRFYIYGYWQIRNFQLLGSIKRSITVRELGRRTDTDLTLPTRQFTTGTCKATILWLV